MGIKYPAFLYPIYSYIANIIGFACELLPNFLRRYFFKLVLKKFGGGSWVDYKCYFRYPWRVSIGKEVAINRGCEFYPSIRSEAGNIILEDNCVLGPSVRVYAAGHDYSRLDLPDISAPVRICSYAWVGASTIILPGVTIGEGAVIGASSVVTHDISPFSVAVGSPARVIKTRVINDQ